MKRRTGLYYEEFSVGQVFEHAWTRTLTEADNMNFSLMTMNVQPLHIDADFASRTEFKKPLVNSLFTLGLVIGMSVNDTTHGTTVANLGMSDVTFPKPAFAGDTVHVVTKVLSMRESKSRPANGIVEFEHLGINQKGETICRCVRQALMHRKPAGVDLGQVS